MELEDTERRGMGNLLRRFHTRFILLAVVAAIAAAIGAGLALAKTGATAIGTGVVVINTNLAYQGGAAAGTGMVLTSSGEVLTNNHVIQGATTIKIVLPGTGRSYTAKVVGYDVADDVAVLQATGASNLKTVSLGNSAAVKVGQVVKAVGNAGGTGAIVSASGRVTGVARTITVSDEQGGSEQLSGLIETNAALQPGDSGGPLVNAAGKVIGIDTAGSVGYGFRQYTATDGYAIPINKAVAIVKKIVAGQSSATIHVGGTAFLGVEISGAGSNGSGAQIAAVIPGGAAEAASLTAGDTITSFDGHAITSSTTLGSIMATEKPGAHVSVTYLDPAGASHTATVTLGSGPPQ
jgi:S1-C subfamily serine protease